VVPPLPVAGSGAPTNWWQRSEAAKAALRALLKDGAYTLETGAMRDELDSHDLAFIPADRSDSCHQAPGPPARPRTPTRSPPAAPPTQARAAGAARSRARGIGGAGRRRQVCASAQHPNASRREEKGPAMVCRVGWFNAINHCPVVLAGPLPPAPAPAAPAAPASAMPRRRVYLTARQ
jgi:hypothetical protein